jgi:hypothetical protein
MSTLPLVTGTLVLGLNVRIVTNSCIKTIKAYSLTSGLIFRYLT